VDGGVYDKRGACGGNKDSIALSQQGLLDFSGDDWFLAGLLECSLGKKRYGHQKEIIAQPWIVIV
jgi:hypothetical protein